MIEKNQDYEVDIVDMGFEGEGITTIEDYAFASSNVAYVDFPNLEIIGRYAFVTTWALEGINFPKLKEIYLNAFDTSSLRYAYLPELKQVHGFAFQKCWLLKDFYAPKLDALHGIRGSEGRHFQGCSILSSLDLPFVEKINIETFDCYNELQCGLKLIEFSKVKTIKSLPSSNDYETTKKDITVVLPSTLTECCSLILKKIPILYMPRQLTNMLIIGQLIMVQHLLH